MSDAAHDTNNACILEALQLAYRDALREHRIAGVPIVIMDNGNIEAVPAEVIEQELDAVAAGGNSDRH